MVERKLTKAQRRALVWMGDNSPAHLFPVAGPRFPMIKKLAAMGMIESAGAVGMFSAYTITDAGRAALSQSGETL